MKDRIKKIRKDAKLTQTQFGDALGGKALSTVQKWEMGHNQPDAGTIELICKKFGVNELWLRTGTGDPKPSQSIQQEMAALVDELTAPEYSASFRTALLTTLLRFEPGSDKWKLLEEIYEKVAEEYRQSQTPQAGVSDQSEK